ncbi:MAG: ribosomal protein S18-alanine N-acetyltransferase [Pyrinomonadaceae bacterium]
MANHLDNLTTQNAKLSDAPAIRQLAYDAKIDAWTEADYAVEICRPDSFVVTTTSGGELIGFLVARLVPGKGAYPDAELYNIAVATAFKRRGIGKRLVVALLDRLEGANVQNVWLEVRASNSDAIAFYESHGFCSEMTRPNFYVNPTESAVIMALQIGSESDVSEA